MHGKNNSGNPTVAGRALQSLGDSIITVPPYLGAGYVTAGRTANINVNPTFYPFVGAGGPPVAAAGVNVGNCPSGQVYFGTLGAQLQFRSLCAGSGIDIALDTPATGDIQITNTGAGAVPPWVNTPDTVTSLTATQLNPAAPNYPPVEFLFPMTTTEQAGFQMFFDATGSFRAGVTSGAAWTAANRGATSAAFGVDNEASGDNSAAIGGANNGATSTNSCVAGGDTNFATGFNSAILGGVNNEANGSGSVAVGGASNVANEAGSVCMGTGATDATFANCFVWGDAHGATATAANQFMSKSSGGVVLLTDALGTTGLQMAAGGSTWIVISDRRLKEGVEDVDNAAVLEAVCSVPLHTYRYIGGTVRNVGVMAQDWNPAVAPLLGGSADAMTVSTGEMMAAALAGVQALRRENIELRNDINLLKKHIMAT